MGVLHAGVFDNSYGPGYHSYDVDNDHAGGATAMGHEPQNPGTSDVIWNISQMFSLKSV